MVFEKVCELLGNQLQIDPKSIKREDRLFEDLHADSANVMILVMDIEQEFDLTVDDNVLPTIHTVGDIVEYLEKTVK